MNFHYIARGVIFQADTVLLVREVGSELTFLPGGHIEVGEPARAALQREILEESGIIAEVGNFLGAVESHWQETIGQQFEINLLFSANIPYTTQVHALEPHLEFLWAPRRDLPRLNLMPSPLAGYLIQKVLPTGFWGSTLE